MWDVYKARLESEEEDTAEETQEDEERNEKKQTGRFKNRLKNDKITNTNISISKPKGEPT